MAATLAPEYEVRFKAYETEATNTARLCKNLLERLLPPKGNSLPDIKGFTFEQYQAARKTLEVALKLFSPDDSLEQLKRSHLDINVSQISMNLMWVDLCKSGRRSKEEESEYHKIYLLAGEKLKELNQLIANRAQPSLLSQQ